jgi:hypothetical protein
LTNAQIANKKELERIKAEKEGLEREKMERDAAANASAGVNGAANVASANAANQELANQQQLKQLYQKTHTTNNNTTTTKDHTSKRLNLPQNIQRDTSDSRSVSSKSIMDRFRDLRPNRQHNPNMYYPRFHPDAQYYNTPGVRRERAFSGDTYNDQTANHAGVSMASTIMPAQITLGQDGHPNNNNNNHRDKIQITPIPERNVVPPPKNTCFSAFWIFYSYLVTLFIPDVLLCCIGRHAKYTNGMNEAQKGEVRKAKKEARQAWREKVGIFTVMILCSCAFIGVSGVIPVLLCRETTVFVSTCVVVYVMFILWCCWYLTFVHPFATNQSL